MASPFLASHLAVQKLRKRGEFLAAAKARTMVRHGIVVQCRLREDIKPHMGLGVTATRKLGTAVVRGRVKRRLRALARQVLPEYGRQGHDYVFIGRNATHSKSFQGLIRDSVTALKALHKDGAK